MFNKCVCRVVKPTCETAIGLNGPENNSPRVNPIVYLALRRLRRAYEPITYGTPRKISTASNEPVSSRCRVPHNEAATERPAAKRHRLDRVARGNHRQCKPHAPGEGEMKRGSTGAASSSSTEIDEEKKIKY
eukprot:scaffold19638_cov107-Isochrysis_galbana.AAC.1